MTKLNKIITPSSLLIEKTAGELAGVFYDECRKQGMKSKHKTARAFARANLETFIPKATELLIDIMSRPETSEEKKRLIYDAIMERTNDDQLIELGKTAKLPEFENTILYKRDDEKPKPVIINTEKFNG